MTSENEDDDEVTCCSISSFAPRRVMRLYSASNHSKMNGHRSARSRARPSFPVSFSYFLDTYALSFGHVSVVLRSSTVGHPNALSGHRRAYGSFPPSAQYEVSSYSDLRSPALSS